MACILVIDQDPDFLGLTSGALRSDGHSTIETSDPVDALSLLTQRYAEIELIVIDVDMKPVSGFEFVKRMARARIRIPVLFTSGCPHLSGVISTSLGDGCVIDKPFTSQALLKAVKNSLSRSQRKNPRAGGPLRARLPVAIRSVFRHTQSSPHRGAGC